MPENTDNFPPLPNPFQNSSKYNQSPSSTPLSTLSDTSPFTFPEAADTSVFSEIDDSAEIESMRRIVSRLPSVYTLDEIHIRPSKSAPLILSPIVEDRVAAAGTRTGIFQPSPPPMHSPEALETTFPSAFGNSALPDASADMQLLESVQQSNLMLAANLHALRQPPSQCSTAAGETLENPKGSLHKRLDALAASLANTTEKTTEVKLLSIDTSNKIRIRFRDLKRLEGRIAAIAVKRKTIKDGISKDALLLGDMDLKLSKRYLDLGMERTCSL
ncbi:hypothetical protein HK096_003959 [Nowakowskiella sp. JEL0078]|nr:hypothetical protein HK096_003959 [Nowakowskiella sp. JEL0078]